MTDTTGKIVFENGSDNFIPKTTEKMPELKPCPFCGGEDIRFSMKVSNRYTGKNHILYHSAMYCNDCNTYGKRTVCRSTEKYRPSDKEESAFQNEAITAWNTRPDAAYPVTKEAAQQMIESLDDMNLSANDFLVEHSEELRALLEAAAK